MKARFLLTTMLIAAFGCRMDSAGSLVLNGPLSTCQTNSTCTYSFYNNADFTGNQPVAGGFRVFVYNSTNSNICGISSKLIFKASLSESQFVIGSAYIASGKIIADDRICPCCDYFVLIKPVGGEIKGKRVDNNHWLINAKIYMGFQDKATDALTVNQYFSVKSL